LKAISIIGFYRDGNLEKITLAKIIFSFQLVIGALGHWGIGALGHWGIGALGHWGIGALGHWGI
jgi:hypothetical protein